MPVGHVGAPPEPLGKAHSGCPNRLRSWRATIRAAPLARRTLSTLEAKGGISSGHNAFSSPREIKRWPTMMPGNDRASIAT